jgi:ATP-binding cassette subfamily C protein LapB
MAFVAARVDAFSRSSLKLRAMRTLRALRLEARPSPAEWGASVLLGVLGLATPLAAYFAFDRLAHGAGDAWTLSLVMLAALAAVVAEAAVRYARVHLADRAERTRETLRAARALSRLAASPMDGAVEDGAPARAARLEAAAAFIELRTGGLRRAVLDLPFAAIAILAMALIGHWVALAPLALVATVVVLFAGASPWAADAARARDTHDARGDDFIAECAANHQVIKGAAMEPFFARRMEQLLASGRDHEWRRIRASDRAEDLSSLIEAATALAVAAIGGVMALTGAISLGALVACTLLAAGAVRPVVRIAAAAQRAAALGPERELDETEHAAPALRAATAPAVLRMDARVARVRPRIRIDMSAGEILAFTGRDGAAMSAVLRAIAGLETPEDGEIMFAGAPAGAYRAAHPGAIALVTPRAALLSGTVMENLTLFGQGAGEAQALAACDILGLRPDIDRLPRQLDTIVGDSASGDVSGALAHRICLARAIALAPRLLLLDEPQAMLHGPEDRQLLAGLASLRGRMMIVIATSRPSYLALADRAYALDEERFALLPAGATPRQAARRAGVA